MSEETNNQGRLDTQAYKADPANVDAPTSLHHKYEKGVRAETLITQQDVVNDIATNVKPFLPTQDQKDALDGANAPSSANPFATTNDLTTLSTTQSAFTWRTDTSNPADGEAKMDNADPALATIVRLSNINEAGLNIANILLLLGAGDAIMIADADESTKVYNFDVTGTVTQVGGTGSGGYVEIGVTYYSQGTGGLISDANKINSILRYDGSSSLFLAKASNLSDLGDVATARANLGVYAATDVYTKVESDTRYLQISSNLGDLADVTVARGNLDVYSTTQVDSLVNPIIADVALNTAHRTSTGVDHGYINQDVTTAGNPSFASVSGNGTALTPVNSIGANAAGAGIALAATATGGGTWNLYSTANGASVGGGGLAFDRSGVGNLWFLDSSGNLRIPGDYRVQDNATYISKDGSNNMTFTDAVSGTQTLADLIGGGASLPNQTNAYYVSKAGNDSNSGLSSALPKLTIGSALTAAAGQTPGVSNKFSVIIMDAGIYTENINCQQYVDIIGPSATVNGAITIHNDVHLVLKELTRTDGDVLGTSSNTGTCWIEIERLNQAQTGPGSYWCFDCSSAMTMYATVGNVLTSGYGFRTRSNPGANINVNCRYISASNASGAAYALDATNGLITADIGRIVAGVGGYGIRCNGGDVNARVTDISAGGSDAYEVNTGDTLNLLVGTLTGTETNSGTANVTKAGAAGGSTAWGSITGTLSAQTDLQSALDGKEPSFSKNTAFNDNYGTGAGTVCEGNDSRLSDARTPTAHAATHTNGTDDIQSATASQKGLMTSTQAGKLDDCPTSDPTGVTGADAITNMMSLTQAEYDAIGTPDASTLYVIT